MCGANLLKICEINTKYFYKETLPQSNVLTRNTPPEQTSDKTNVHNSGSPSFWLAQLASQTRNVKKSRPFLCQHAEQLKKQVEPSNPLKTVAHRTPIVHYSKPHYLRHSYKNPMSSAVIPFLRALKAMYLYVSSVCIRIRQRMYR